MRLYTKNKELIYFGSRIKYYRLKLGLSQEELAFKCNLTISKVSMIETGKVNIGIITLIRLIKVLRIELNDIVDLNPNKD